MNIKKAYQGVKLNYKIGMINLKINRVNLKLCNHREAICEYELLGPIRPEFLFLLATRDVKMEREINNLTNKREELRSKLVSLTN